MGRSPGLTMAKRSGSGPGTGDWASAASSPALATEDLPEPDGPRTVSSRVAPGVSHSDSEPLEDLGGQRLASKKQVRFVVLERSQSSIRILLGCIRLALLTFKLSDAHTVVLSQIRKQLRCVSQNRLRRYNGLDTSGADVGSRGKARSVEQKKKKKKNRCTRRSVCPAMLGFLPQKVRVQRSSFQRRGYRSVSRELLMSVGVDFLLPNSLFW